MNPRLSNNRLRSASIFLLSFATSFFLFFLLGREYIVSDFVYSDDTRALSKALFGEDDITQYAASPTIYLIIYGLAGFDSVTLIKICCLAFYSAGAGLIAVLFSHVVGGLALPVLVALTIVTFPIAPTQAIFATGSHPTIAVAFIVGALTLYTRARDYSGWKFAMAIGTTGILLLCAAETSITASLAPLALSAWLLVSYFLSSDTKKYLFALPFTLLATTSAYFYFGLIDYHFSGIPGHTDISAHQIGTNLVASISKVYSYSLGSSAGAQVLYIAALLTLVFSLLLNRLPHFKDQPPCPAETPQGKYVSLSLGLNGLVLSALAFGPTSVTTFIQDRYLIVTITMGGLAIAGFFLYILGRPTTRSRIALAIALVVLTSVNTALSTARRDSELRGYYDTHRHVIDLVHAEQHKWTRGAQVLILVANENKTAAEGVNHWSTWYIRLLTRRSDLLALVGNPKGIQSLPFVEEYSDNGPIFRMLNRVGRSIRIKMLGFEAHRPIFAYRQTDAGDFKALDYLIFPFYEQVKAVPQGVSLLGATDASSNLRISDPEENPDVFIWPPSKIARVDGRWIYLPD